MFSDFRDSGETTSLAAPIKADDFRFEPLEPGVSFGSNPQTKMFSSYARTAAWNTPDDGITFEHARPWPSHPTALPCRAARWY
jgi:hypothetical protein